MSLKTKLNKETIWTFPAACFAVMLALLVCFFLKDDVIACHDSFADFVYARMHTFSESYIHNLEFNLARGRVGFIASFVNTLRFLVLSTGNYTAVYLLQQVPIWFTVCLIAWVIGKKTRPYCGFMFIAFYAVFVQIDNNHNLMDCYPLDFMYGMSLMVLGLWFYDSWICHLGQKRNIFRIIASVFFYYESMTVYEPFITACLIYALISFAHVISERNELKKKAFFEFVKRLIPHAITAVIFFAIIKILKAFPVVETVEVTAVDEYGDFHDFEETWRVFSLSLFPLSNIDRVSKVSSYSTLFEGIFMPAFCFSAAGSMISTFFASRHASMDKTSRKAHCLRLLVIGISGLLYAVFFTVPHAMTANYQMWVRDLNAEGYLTSSMCYFGWALAFTCLLLIIIDALSRRGKILFAVSCIVMSFLFLTAAELTMNINTLIRADDSNTGRQMSLRGQAFYSFFSSDYAEDYAAQFIYTPGYTGIHYHIEMNDEYADFEADRSLSLTNDASYFRDESVYYDYCGEFCFNPDVDAAFYTGIANPEDRMAEWVSNGNLVIISTLPGVYEVSYFDPEADAVLTQDIEMGHLDVYVIENNVAVPVSSLTITNK